MACDTRVTQLLQVASLLTDIELSLRRLPLILAGDLNSLPESAVCVASIPVFESIRAASLASNHFASSRYALLNDASVDARHPEVANDQLSILDTGACAAL